MITAMQRRRYTKVAALYAIFALPMALTGYVVTRNINATPLKSDQVVLTATKDVYAHGEKVQLLLSNGSDNVVYVQDHCPEPPLNISYKKGQDWTPVHEKSSTVVCANSDRNFAIKPHTSAPIHYDDWPHLFARPGLYRISAQLENYPDPLIKDIQVE